MLFVIFKCLLPYLVRYAFSIKLDLTRLTRLASQWPPGIFLSLLPTLNPNAEVIDRVHRAQALYGCWKSELRPSSKKSKHFCPLHHLSSPTHSTLNRTFLVWLHSHSHTLRITWPWMTGKKVYDPFPSKDSNVMPISHLILSAHEEIQAWVPLTLGSHFHSLLVCSTNT